jgi:hypothetical protein
MGHLAYVQAYEEFEVTFKKQVLADFLKEPS